eukprot:TRINITY_DN9362_c0_g1_i1.p1 TRINITY_DN9362_c0_g1~~TRINITY_DN9362_c0_g1_i1.p1  ORF type:complete len:186 (-),score=32.39 TRINITY_DN9362_c0_g1_i1:148-705(-)
MSSPSKGAGQRERDAERELVELSVHLRQEACAIYEQQVGEKLAVYRDKAKIIHSLQKQKTNLAPCSPGSRRVKEGQNTYDAAYDAALQFQPTKPLMLSDKELRCLSPQGAHQQYTDVVLVYSGILETLDSLIDERVKDIAGLQRQVGGMRKRLCVYSSMIKHGENLPEVKSFLSQAATVPPSSST